MNKKILITSILSLLIVTSIGAWYLMSVQKPKKVVISGHPEWAPIMYREDTQISGAGPEIAQKILHEMGIEANSEYVGNWEIAQNKTKLGEVDMLVAAYKTDEREQYMDYSIPYTVDPVVLIVKKGENFQYENWEDLVDKKGVISTGDSYGEEFDNFIEKSLNVEQAENPDDAFKYLLDGEADYFVYALYSAEDHINHFDLSGKVEILPGYISAENFYFTVSQKSPLAKHLPEFNEILQRYINEGEIDRIIDKHKQALWN